MQETKKMNEDDNDTIKDKIIIGGWILVFALIGIGIISILGAIALDHSQG